MGEVSDSSYLDTPSDLVAGQFQRSPPAILRGVDGPAAGSSLRLGADVWQSSKWLLDETLRELDPARRDTAAGLLLMCVNGMFYGCAANDESPCWLRVNSSAGGPGGVPLGVGDEFCVGGWRLAVEAAPHAEDARSDEDTGDAAGDSGGSEGEEGARAAAGGFPPKIPAKWYSLSLYFYLK